jgi:hypothetical protein
MTEIFKEIFLALYNQIDLYDTEDRILILRGKRG